MRGFYTIPFEANFLESFVDACLDLKTCENQLIFLPTKRACRTLREILLKKAKQQVIHLPKIIALSDIDTPFLISLSQQEKWVDKCLNLGKKINPIARFFLLTQMIMKASTLTKSIYQAGKLSGDLGSLITALHDERSDPDLIAEIVPEKYATHWQKTLDFLKIITEFWPGICESLKVKESSQIRNDAFEILIEMIEEGVIDTPLFVLGTNASLPIVKQLVKAVVKHPKGAFVFHGFEKQESYVESHPQYAYHQLLDYCGVSEVKTLVDQATVPNLTYIPCKRLSQEAQICGLILRETIINPDKNCAVITNNVDLIRQIKQVLKIWNIEINDSSGEPLDQTHHFDFLKLVFEAYQQRDKKVILLSLLKHPLCQVKMDRGEWIRKIREIEKPVFRSKKKAECDFLKDIDAFYDAWEFDIQTVKDWIELSIEALNFFSNDRFFESDTGEIFLHLFDEIIAYSEEFEAIDLSLYLILLEQLVKQKLSYVKEQTHPRLTILGPYEARLQHFDRVIVASCNEENWIHPSVNPFLSQAMLKSLNLPSQEMIQGRTALDFFQCLGMKEVFITRSLLDQGSPMTKLRWLDDIEIKEENAQEYSEWLSYFSEIKAIQSIDPPDPKPKIEARPNQFSVSDIELLVRDPYSIYAKKILRLRPLEEIEPSLSMAEYGSFIHLFLYSLKAETPFDMTQEVINFPSLIPYIKFFKLRLEALKNNFYDIDPLGKTLGLEKKGQMQLGDITLTAIADRIDMRDAKIEVIDYKTGIPPSLKDISSGYSPQSIIELMILKAGGFEIKSEWEVSFAFWQVGREISIKVNDKTIEQDIVNYRAGLLHLFEAFKDIETPYYAQPFPLKSPRYNDYLHLSRVKEWLN